MIHKYFKNSSYTFASLEKERKQLSFRHHPDKGGRESDFIAMNEEYESIIEVIKNPPKETSNKLQVSKPVREKLKIEIEPEKEYDGLIDAISPRIAAKYFHNANINAFVICGLFIIGLGSAMNENPVFFQIAALVLSMAWIILIGSKFGYFSYLIFYLIIVFTSYDAPLIALYGIYGFPISRIGLYLYRNNYLDIFIFLVGRTFREKNK